MFRSVRMATTPLRGKRFLRLNRVLLIAEWQPDYVRDYPVGESGISRAVRVPQVRFHFFGFSSEFSDAWWPAHQFCWSAVSPS